MADLHHRLVYETDPFTRATIHLELATLAVGDGNFDSAARHFREALLLDSRLDRAREGLRGLGEHHHRPAGPRPGGLRGLWERVRPKG